MVLDFGTEALKVLSGRGRILYYLDDYEEQEGYSKAVEMLFRELGEKPEKVIVSLPPNVLKARIASAIFKRKTPQKIVDEKEEKEIINVVLQRVKKEVASDFSRASGIFPEHLRFISLRILDRGIKIDGYEVPRIRGFEGKILEFSLQAQFLPGVAEIERILRQKIADFKIIHAAEGLMKFIRDWPDGIFLDVGGEITQIFLARGGKLEIITEFAAGGKIFSETISERLGLREKDARILKERYSKGELSLESSTKIKEMFYFPQREWFDKLKAKLNENQGGLLFPSSIFLFGGASQLPEIKEILQTGNWGNIAFFNVKPEVKIINDPQFMPSLLLKSYG